MHPSGPASSRCSPPPARSTAAILHLSTRGPHTILVTDSHRGSVEPLSPYSHVHNIAPLVLVESSMRNYFPKNTYTLETLSSVFLGVNRTVDDRYLTLPCYIHPGCGIAWLILSTRGPIAVDRFILSVFSPQVFLLDCLRLH